MFPKARIIPMSNSNRISDYDLLWYYFGIGKLGVTNSPFRVDSKPSFGLYEKSGKIYFKDFATSEHGSIIDMVMYKYGLSFSEAMVKIQKDFSLLDNPSHIHITKTTKKKSLTTTTIKIQTRQWMEYDYIYFEMYGIKRQFIQQFDIYPINYYWVNDNCFKADKIAYAYVEFVDNKPYFKVYQPFSQWKWCNNYPTDTISLIDKIPVDTTRIIICSSVKDALCLWCNTGIPCISPQGEGYDLPMDKLRQRFKKADFRLLFDNDEKGIEFSKKLSEKYKIPNIIIPEFIGGKDISDLYLVKGNLSSLINI